jgi:hypothetical protein
MELSALCAPEVRAFLAHSEITLVGFAQVPHLLGALT